jgi:hypothetical protein
MRSFYKCPSWRQCVLVIGTLAFLPTSGCNTATCSDGRLSSREEIVSTNRCGHTFVLEMEIGGDRPYRFMVDSGAAWSLLSPDSLHELLGAGAVTLATQPAEGPIKAVVARASAGGWVLEDWQVIVLDQPFIFRGDPGVRLDGILGYDAFCGRLVTFDYARSELRIGSGSLRRHSDARALWTYEGRPFLPVHLQGRLTPVLLDTGAGDGLSLPADTSLDFVSAPVLLGTVLTANGVESYLGSRLRGELEIGGLRIHEPPVTFTSWNLAIAGVELLRYFQVTFDASANLARLVPNVVGPISIDPREGIGATARHDSGQWHVDEVRPGSLAHRAGVQAGDVILSMWETTMPSHPCDPLGRATTASDVAFRVCRNGAEIILTPQHRE